MRTVHKALMSSIWGLSVLLSMRVNAEPPLVVALDDNYPPYSFRDDQGHLVGLREDMWRLWAQVNQQPVHFVTGNWHSVLTAVQTGTAEVIDNIFDIPSRQNIYQFGPSYASVPVRVYFDKNISGIRDISELQGFTVGVKTGDACALNLQAAGISTLVYYNEYSDLVQAALKERLRVFCMDEPPAIYLMLKAGIQKNFRATDPISTGQMTYAVLRGNAPLLEHIRVGFGRIPDAQIQAVHERWLGHGSVLSLHSRYLKIISLILALAVLWIGLLLLWGKGLRVRVAQRTHDLVNALGELQQAHDAADEARENLMAVIDAIPDLLFEVDGEGRAVSYRTQNHVLANLIPPERFLGKLITEVVPDAMAAVILAAIEEARLRGYSHGQTIGLNLGAGIVWFELSVGRKRTADEHLERYIILARDISERRMLAEELARHRNHLEELVQGKTRLLAQANVRLTQLSRIQRALSRCSQALVRAIREEEYQKDICEIVVEECGHRMCWAGLVRDDAEGTIRPQAWAGEGTDYLDELKATDSEGTWDMGPVGRAVRTGQPVVTTDCAEDPEFIPWKNAAAEHGFHSCIVVPFEVEQGEQGVFSIYAGQPYAFSSEEIDLLQELVTDFAYGIGVIRLRNQHNTSIQKLAQKAAEEAQARLQQESLAAQLQLILDTMDSSIIVWDSEQRLRLWNRRTSVLFPKSASFLRVNLPRDEFLSILRSNGEQFDTYRSWTQWQLPAHDIVHVRDGRILEYTRLLAVDDSHMIMITDITELTLMRDTLQRNERLAALGGMVAGVAHEMNTPIGIALTASSNLTEAVGQIYGDVEKGQIRRSALSVFLQDCKEASQLIENNLRRAVGMISSFKQVAVDQTSERRRVFDLAIMLQELIMTLRPMLKPKGHILELTHDNQKILMDSYPGPLGQVVTNFVSNAVTHAFGTREHGKINLRMRLIENDTVELCFEDDGVGIRPEHLLRIFDPFFTTRMGSGGTGLGLHIVHTLVTSLLGGTIEVHSVEGQGTQFVLMLPRVTQLSNEAADTVSHAEL